MERPPRPPTERLFARPIVTVALLQGMLAFALVSLVLGLAVWNGYDDGRSRALAFSALVMVNLALILENRSWSRGALAMLRVPNTALWCVVGGAIGVLALSLAVAPLRSVFRFGVPSGTDLLTVLVTFGAALTGFELLKRLGRAPSAIVLIAAASLLSARVVQAEPPAGERLYRRYCAACHGVEGRGDGPVSDVLTPRAADLTRLETSLPELMRQIDGRRTIRAHGTAAMPVWGEIFEQSLIAEPHKRRTALLMTQMIAEYVQDLRKAPRKE